MDGALTERTLGGEDGASAAEDMLVPSSSEPQRQAARLAISATVPEIEEVQQHRGEFEEVSLLGLAPPRAGEEPAHMLPYMGSSDEADASGDGEGAQLLPAADASAEAKSDGWSTLRHTLPALHFRLPPPRRPRARLTGMRQVRRVVSSGFLRGMERVESASAAVKTMVQGDANYKLLLWVGASALFGLGMFLYKGASSVAQYFAGYLVEQSLSVDNLFVFNLVFSYFRTPPLAQDKALAWGILGAAIMRAIFILLGAALLARFEWLLGIFALILVYSAIKLLFEEEDDDSGDLSDNWAVRLCRRLIPVTDRYEGDRFISAERSPEGRARFTPLVLVVAVIEISDVVFAVDSIPAVFGVTQDPFLVYTSNIFAILSLRALYAFVNQAVASARFLQPAVALVLFFIGCKMILGLANVLHVGVSVSLAVVAGILGTGVALSVAFPAPPEEVAELNRAPPPSSSGHSPSGVAGGGTASNGPRVGAELAGSDVEMAMKKTHDSSPHGRLPTLAEGRNEGSSNNLSVLSSGSVSE